LVKYRAYLTFLQKVFTTKEVIHGTAPILIAAGSFLLLVLWRKNAITNSNIIIATITSMVGSFILYKAVKATLQQPLDPIGPRLWSILQGQNVATWNLLKEPKDYFVDGIITRKTTDPKDKAFGVRALLECIEGPLPAPDYSRPVADIFRELTFQLLSATGSLHAIVPAALFRCPGQPSWVADWSKEIPPMWAAYFKFIDTDARSVSSQEPIWAPNLSDENALVVRGRNIGHISSYFGFQTTAGQYQDSELDTHLDNLKALLDFVKIGFGKRRDDRRTWERVFSYPYKDKRKDSEKSVDVDHFFRFFVDQNHHVFNTQRIETGATEITNWTNFLYKYRRKSPSEVLRRLKAEYSDDLRVSRQSQGQNIPRRGTRKILPTHIAMCNYLAATRTGLVVCEYESAVSSAFESLPDPICKRGICTNDVRAGDKIISLSGLSFNLLVVREENGSTQLLSPVATTWPVEEKDPKFWDTVNRVDFILC
jgi:hypothetical protein